MEKVEDGRGKVDKKPERERFDLGTPLIIGTGSMLGGLMSAVSMELTYRGHQPAITPEFVAESLATATLIAVPFVAGRIVWWELRQRRSERQ